MQRRHFIASAGTGLVTLAAGCMSSDDDEGTPTTKGTGTTTSTGTDTGTTNSTGTAGENTTTDTTGDENEGPQFEITSTSDGRVKIVHMGGGKVTGENISKVAVTVNGERAVVLDDGDTEHAYFAAKEDALGPEETAAVAFPISVGNRVYVTAEPGSTIAIVATTTDDAQRTLAEKTIGEESTGTTTGTTTTGTTTNGTTTGTESDTETTTQE
ncbi:hypothetical protein [Haloarchaeobius sp. TZWWS8]|uniref:hypothetical protein n=1 Tax=Haloarchaeobius sp. TZWWS8 TaxID=3446121 RepID=UPI003EBC314B